MPDSLNVSWTDVANKALDMGENAVGEVVTIIEQAAPKTWEIAMRQVYADAIGHILIPLFFMLFFLLVMWAARLWWLPSKEERKQDPPKWGNYWHRTEYSICWGIIIPSCLTFASFFIAGCLSVRLVKILINPEYYAIQLILKLAGVS